MRPRGQTPRMPVRQPDHVPLRVRFNEAAGADPADACIGVERFAVVYLLQ